jgi:outer membrane murein-binding lipoprotein Lpp
MRRVLGVMFAASALLLGGCATKKYVAQRVDPINAKVNEVDKNQQNTQKQLEGDEPKISAADEKATSADGRATDALGRADAASKKTDQVRDQLRSELNDRIANLDDYKSAGDVTVLFKFNSAKLTDEGKQQLDRLVSGPVGIHRQDRHAGIQSGAEPPPCGSGANVPGGAAQCSGFPHADRGLGKRQAGER